MTDQAQSAFHRLILDLYHGAADAETMRAAAEFARLLRLDLHCLFIEDEALLALAELPFAREIRLPTHEWTQLDTKTVAAEFGQAVAQTRHLMNEVIRGMGVTGEFEVLSGDPAACIAAVCQASDIVVVAEPGPPAARTAHGVTRLRAAAHASAASVLLLPAHLKPRPGYVVAVLTDATDASLDVACGIATAANEGVMILLTEPVPEAAADSLKDRAHALGVPLEWIKLRTAQGTQAGDVLHALADLRERLIVMTRSASALGDSVSASHIATARRVPLLLLEPKSHTDQPSG
jgi:hypothetical protein